MKKDVIVRKDKINDILSQKMYRSLFGEESQEKFLSFRFLVLSIEDEEAREKIADIFLELFSESAILYIDERPVIFYITDQGYEVKNLLWSIIDDFGIKVSIFNSGKINSREAFLMIYDLYERYISLEKYHYYGVGDLVLEIIKKDMHDLQKYRKILLNNVAEDPQLEKLILAMFDNNLNVTKTASEVYMHRNTINNKLDYIKKETGMNIQEFKDAVSMYWLIKFK
ncbi:MAG: helix-turn-helix domain-containing protein [Bacilli bacterium]|jgi:hypothetical protein|nr:helix-turn-helix domain-containing protein [Bacilli bacterium]MDD3349167.1 helix-turn-helix domain-containing protein [Bacilli bacterium]MDD4057177.1 helix-turn-helix domain-containing protein [Bacilli bacterium]